MNVAYYGRKAQPGVPYEFVGDLGALAEKSDVLALACPGGKETHHLVNAAVLEKLGAGGYLVNVARGSVVDEAALLDALENKKIAGAALDVFASEPNIDARFLPLENVVLQPHSRVDHARDAHGDGGADIVRYRRVSEWKKVS